MTIGVQTACVTLHIAGFISGSVVEQLWMAIMLYETPLGLWLLFRGNKHPNGLATSVD